MKIYRQLDEFEILILDDGDKKRKPCLVIPAFTWLISDVEFHMNDLYNSGFMPVAFNLFKHDEMTDMDKLFNMGMDNFRLIMWKILGMSIMRGIKVLAYIIKNYNPTEICATGFSLGGEVAIALSMYFPITKVLSFMSSPTWNRVGSEIGDLGVPNQLTLLLYNIMDPIININSVCQNTKFLMIGGSNDKLIPVQLMEQLQKKRSDQITIKTYPVDHTPADVKIWNENKNFLSTK